MDWAELIQSVGLQGAMILGLGWYVKYIQDKADQERTTRQESTDRRMDEMHKTNREDSNAMREALNNNTLVLKLLLQKVGIPDDLDDTARMRAIKEDDLRAK